MEKRLENNYKNLVSLNIDFFYGFKNNSKILPEK